MLAVVVTFAVVETRIRANISNVDSLQDIVVFASASFCLLVLALGVLQTRVRLRRYVLLSAGALFDGNAFNCGRY